MLEAGQVIDRYEVLELLGEGGMARVYRVRHTTLHSEHALKVLTVQSKGIRSRLIAEGRAQASLSHPHVIHVTDVVDVQGAPGLVMEYVPAGSLSDWIETAPSREVRLAVFEQVCRAVAEAHRRGWVHRDLKPGNILIADSDAGPVAKVADFGLVKAVVGDTLREGPRTRGGLPMGTPGFMAPEQIEDAAGVDARADVFSLGCILVWLLTGQSPFEAPTVLDTFARVAAGDRESLPPTDPLYAVSEKALASRPEDRFPDAGALLAGLSEQALPTSPSQPGPPSPPPATATTAPRPAIPWPLVAAGIGLGLGGIATAALGVACLGLGVSGGRSIVKDSGCDLSADEAIGFVRMPDVKIRAGAVRELSQPTPVFASPGDEEPVCTLPQGTSIEARHSTRFNMRGTWLQVHGDGVTLP